jgi:hypothetical protein
MNQNLIVSNTSTFGVAGLVVGGVAAISGAGLFAMGSYKQRVHSNPEPPFVNP